MTTGLEPYVTHRPNAELSLCNGKPLLKWNPRETVPCEVCGAPVFLLVIENLCEPGVRRRKVAVVVEWTWVWHTCGRPEKIAARMIRCEVCDERQWQLLAEASARIREHMVEADRHLREADRLQALAAAKFEQAAKLRNKVTEVRR